MDDVVSPKSFSHFVLQVCVCVLLNHGFYVGPLRKLSVTWCLLKAECDWTVWSTPLGLFSPTEQTSPRLRKACEGTDTKGCEAAITWAVFTGSFRNRFCVWITVCECVCPLRCVLMWETQACVCEFLRVFVCIWRKSRFFLCLWEVDEMPAEQVETHVLEYLKIRSGVWK